MEAISILAMASASELYRRKIFWMFVLFVAGEFALLSYILYAGSKFEENLATPEMLIPFLEPMISRLFSFSESFGKLLALVAFCSLMPAERRDRTWLPVLAKPISRLQFFTGKFAGAALIVVLFWCATVTLEGLAFILAGIGLQGYFVQAALSILVKFGIVGALGMTLSLRFQPLTAGILAFTLHSTPWFLFLLRSKVPPSVLEALQVFIPGWEHFQLVYKTSHRLEMLPGEFGWILAYGIAWMVTLFLLGALAFSRQDLMLRASRE